MTFAIVCCSVLYVKVVVAAFNPSFKFQFNPSFKLGAFSVIIQLLASRRFFCSSTGHSGLWGSLHLTSNNHIVRGEAGTTADL